MGKRKWFVGEWRDGIAEAEDEGTMREKEYIYTCIPSILLSLPPDDLTMYGLCVVGWTHSDLRLSMRLQTW